MNFQTLQRPKDMAFLAMAVLLHAALLLVPLQEWSNPRPATTTRLTVDLRQLPPPQQDVAEEQAAAPVLEPQAREVQPPDPVPQQRRSARIALEEIPPEPLPETTTVEPPPLSARQLREIVRQAELKQDKADATRQLGTARDWKPPANWNKNAGAPYLAGFDNTFNGMTAPEEVEIVDRWQAADGSHNVVVNYPNGETLCGRAEAYNPLQPLVEPVMMWRPCGGGGKRTFTMPDRYKKGQ